jgi:hypothetical protein
MLGRRATLTHLMAGLGSPVLLLGCGKTETDIGYQQAATQKTSAPAWDKVNLARAIELLFDITTFAIPIGKFFKFSFALGSGLLTLDGKVEAKIGGKKIESSFKLPFNRDKRIESRDDIIRALQDDLNKLKMQIVDDATLLLVARGKNQCEIFPIIDGAHICIESVGVHRTEIRNERGARMIQIEPKDAYSYIEIGDCTTLISGLPVTVVLDANSEVGKYGVFEIQAADFSWREFGRPPVAYIRAENNLLRVRLRQLDRILWDGSFDHTDFQSSCSSQRIVINATMIEEDSESKVICTSFR